MIFVKDGKESINCMKSNNYSLKEFKGILYQAGLSLDDVITDDDDKTKVS